LCVSYDERLRVLMSEAVTSAVLVLGAASLKTWTVYLVARLIKHTSNDAVGSLLGAWLLAHAVIVAALLAASLGRFLSTAFAWSVLIALAAFSFAAVRFRKPEPLGDTITLSVGSVLAGIALAAMAVRSTVFQDFSWDAQTYGLVREAVWMNYGSILVHMPTRQANIFSNEWNGELVALVYGLASGGIQGLMFAGVEVLALTFVATFWCLTKLGASRSWASLCGAAISLTPAGLGLASVIKGDLLAVACAIMAAGYAVSLLETRNRLAPAMFPAAMACSVGSKVTAVTLALALTCLWIAPFVRAVRRCPPALVVGCIVAGAFLSRFAINWVVYKNPLHRVETETVTAGIMTLAKSLLFVADQLFSFSVRVGAEPQAGLLLAGSMGFTVALAVACLVYQWKSSIAPSREGIQLLRSAAVGLVIACFLISAPPWAFRYFMPSVLLVTIVLMAAPRVSRTLIGLAVVAVAANLSYPLWRGEINAVRTFREAIRVLPYMSFRDRALANFGPLRAEFALDKFDFDRSEPLSFAVFQEINTALSPFIGSRAQNRLFMTDSAAALVAATRQRCPDFVVITEPRRVANLRDARQAIAEIGYRWVHESAMVVIAQKLACTPS
jgi:hypothetical protein